MKKKILLIILPILLMSGILLGGSLVIRSKYINTDTIYEGVTIEEISVEGLRKDQALELIQDEKDLEINEKSIDLNYKDYSYTINLKDIKYTFNYKEAIDQAYEIARQGGFISRLRTIRELKNNPVNIQLNYSYHKEAIENIISKIKEDLEEEAKDASISIKNGNINIIPDTLARTLNSQEVLDLIENSLENNLENIQIPIEEFKAQVTEEYLGQINGVIGSYSTSFANSSSGRIHNIELSAQDFNNMLVMPGVEISYNETTGPRQTQFGYQEAPVIVGGQYTPGIGGGVCQTSTTLYNALLHADLIITERSPHSIAPAYVPKGRDGAVAMGYKDLKFKNPYDFPIYIVTSISGSNLEVYIYGDTSAKDYTVKIEPVLIDTIEYEVHEQLDESAQPGSRTLIQEGRNGYKVRTYKSIIKDGQVISRDEISYDYYPELDYIYKLGPKPKVEREEVSEGEEELEEELEEEREQP